MHQYRLGPDQLDSGLAGGQVVPLHVNHHEIGETTTAQLPDI